MARPYKYTPEQLQSKINKYFEYADNNPLIKNEVVKTGKEAGKILPVPMPVVYSIQGLCYHVDISRETFYDLIEKNRAETSENNKEGENNINTINRFSDICTRARRKINENQIDGATTGIFNPLVVSRLQGLTDKHEVKATNTNISVNVVDEGLKGKLDKE